jgi:hypothetical protein
MLPTLSCCAVLLCTACAASESTDSLVSITIYSAANAGDFDPQQFIDQQRAGMDPQSAWAIPGFGVVRETRRMQLPKGEGWVPCTDVAQFLDPTTVRFTDLDDPATSVLEQRMEFDLVNGAKLLQKYIDRGVVITSAMGDQVHRTEGTLLSTNGGQAVIQTSEGIKIVPTNNATIALSSLPEGLRTKPTLLWRVASASGGDHKVRVDYTTAGLTWRADYILVVGADEQTASLAAWVSLLNVSGATWKDAELRLIAGSVRRVQSRRQPESLRMGRSLSGMGGNSGFEEAAFGEYHRYTLGRTVDLSANSTQQLTLFPTADAVKVREELIFDGSYGGGFGDSPNFSAQEGDSGNTTVTVWIIADNTSAAGLGMPLPAGKVRVSQTDAKGSTEFVGEDLIGHTARGATLRLNIGDSFDVTGTRKRMNFSVDSSKRIARETIEITLKSGKPTPQVVTVKEKLWRWSGWTLEEVTVDGKPVELTKVDASTVQRQITVPPEGSSTLRFTAVYSW